MKTIKKTIKNGAYTRTVYEEIPEIFSIDKGTRSTAVESSTVSITSTLGGTLVFDSDEISQLRILRAHYIGALRGLTTIEWKMTDNSKATVSLGDLEEALYQAGIQQQSIWFPVV